MEKSLAESHIDVGHGAKLHRQGGAMPVAPVHLKKWLLKK
jgi:hypothetical protein